MKKVAVIPVYNEEQTIITLLEQLTEYVDLIVVVDDGSVDSTYSLVQTWVKGKKAVWFIHSPENHGMSAAYRNGFYLVNHLLEMKIIHEDDIITTIDADGQHRADYIDKIINFMLERGYDIVLTRRDFSPYPKYKIVGNICLSLHAEFWTHFPYHDIESGYRFIKAKFIPKILLYYTGYKYSCAQEIGIISPLLKMKVNNDFLVNIPIYVSGGTRIRDGIPNIFFGMIAFFRVKFKIRNNMKKIWKHILAATEIIHNQDT